MLKFIFYSLMMIILKNKNAKLNMVLMIIVYNMSWQTNLVQKISYSFMGDSLSFWTLNLTVWLVLILILVKPTNVKFNFKIMNLMMIIFMIAFYSWNFMVFYIMFEMLMMLILIIIMLWSYQPERVDAIMFMIIMTLVFSLPFLTMMTINFKTLNFWYLSLMKLSLIHYISFMFIFMMKLPMYFMHIWLPKVHVESPAQGSMVLAAVMLKLGSYGLIRILPMVEKYIKLNLGIMMSAMWSMVIISMVCFTQIDMKTMIAYSSVVHMMLTMISIIMNKSKGILSSIMIMIGHGLCSSAMFFMANQFYNISKSRSIIINFGISQNMSSFKMMWFIICMMNAPMPPSINTLGEILTFKVVSSWNMMTMMLLFILSVVSSAFSIYLYYNMVHSNYSKTINKFQINTSKSFIIISLHITPMTLIMMKPLILTI